MDTLTYLRRLNDREITMMVHQATQPICGTMIWPTSMSMQPFVRMLRVLSYAQRLTSVVPTVGEPHLLQISVHGALSPPSI